MQKKKKTIVKTLADQSSTSINVVKTTRASNKRKPSRYQLSPYEYDKQRGKPSKFRYGPFRISAPLKTVDAQIIEYVFSMDLPPRLVNIEILYGSVCFICGCLYYNLCWQFVRINL